MDDTFDVIVVGVGTMGAATCLELARRGCRVLGLERFNIPHTFGSHHGASRMIRQAYFEHPDYVNLLQRAYPMWGQLESESGQKLFHQVGALYLGRESSELLQGSLQAAQAYGITHQRLSSEEIQRQFPAFRIPDSWVGCWEPQAGYLRPEASVGAMARLAVEHGATLLAQQPVLEWNSDGRHVEVQTPEARYRAARLVLCGGAWMSQLWAEGQVPLQVTRQVVSWVWPRQPRLFDSAGFPCWAIDPTTEEVGFNGIYYGFPLSQEPPGLKLGWHAPGVSTDPNQVQRQILPQDLEWQPAFFEKFMPEGQGPVWTAVTCLYTYSPDGHFIVDRHPEYDNVCLAGGFSGHGFKFAPVIGQALSELCLDGKSSLPIEFLSLSRFATTKTHS